MEGSGMSFVHPSSHQRLCEFAVGWKSSSLGGGRRRDDRILVLDKAGDKQGLPSPPQPQHQPWDPAEEGGGTKLRGSGEAQG